jgi:hypothetical protein
MLGQSQIYRAIAELAYAIAMVDGELQLEERLEFLDTIEKEWGDDSWIAESRFELLGNEVSPTIEHAYNNALFVVKRNHVALNDQLKAQLFLLIERVAQAYAGTSQAESFVIERFRRDLNALQADPNYESPGLKGLEALRKKAK